MIHGAALESPSARGPEDEMNFSADTTTNFLSQQTLPRAGAGQVQSLLVFYLGERAYGLLIDYVVQIIPMLKLTPVPQVEQVIEGVANIRGKAVPVLSARRYLGMPLVPPRLYTPIILVQTGERLLGLVVDRVADVVQVPDSQVTLPGAIMAGGSECAAFLSGVVYQGDQAIVVLDPRSMLYPSQAQAVSRGIESIVAAAGSGPDGSNGKAPQNGQSKPRRKRRKFETALAGEIAILAADLPPSDGQQAGSSGSAPVSADQPPSDD